ncbi:hypothetical protein [Nostoc piscinale]|nr:hypothetical protein [Nostoc piscinale]
MADFKAIAPNGKTIELKNVNPDLVIGDELFFVSSLGTATV